MSELRILPAGNKQMLTCKPAARIMFDCEFNGRMGAMLSAGMVSDTGKAWYEVRAVELAFEPWVLENVVPQFRKPPVQMEYLLQSLQDYLDQFSYVEFYYNAKADELHLRWLLKNIDNPPICRFVRDGHLSAKASKVPHNALADAEALLDQVCGTTELQHGIVSERHVMQALWSSGIPLSRRELAMRFEKLPMKIRRGDKQVEAVKVTYYPLKGSDHIGINSLIAEAI